MVDRTLRVAFHAGFWIPLALCTWLALTPSPPDAVFRISDVLLHIFAFTYLTFMLCLAFPADAERGALRRWILPALLMFGYGVLLEVLQGTAGARHASLKDLGTDLVGIALGLGAFRVLGTWMQEVAAGALGRMLGSGR